MQHVHNLNNNNNKYGNNKSFILGTICNILSVWLHSYSGVMVASYRQIKLNEHVHLITVPDRLTEIGSLSRFHFYNLEQSTRTVAQVRDNRARTLERQKSSGKSAEETTEADTGGHTNL